MLFRSVYFSALHCVVQCGAVWCSVVQCGAVFRCVLQCVVVCCSVLQCVAVRCSVVQCVAVCCSVLQCVAVCCTLITVKITSAPSPTTISPIIAKFKPRISGTLVVKMPKSKFEEPYLFVNSNFPVCTCRRGRDFDGAAHAFLNDLVCV